MWTQINILNGNLQIIQEITPKVRCETVSLGLIVEKLNLNFISRDKNGDNLKTYCVQRNKTKYVIKKCKRDMRTF